jgi:hypothetical protein
MPSRWNGHARPQSGRVVAGAIMAVVLAAAACGSNASGAASHKASPTRARAFIGKLEYAARPCSAKPPTVRSAVLDFEIACRGVPVTYYVSRDDDLKGRYTTATTQRITTLFDAVRRGLPNSCAALGYRGFAAFGAAAGSVVCSSQRLVWCDFQNNVVGSVTAANGPALAYAFQTGLASTYAPDAKEDRCRAPEKAPAPVAPKPPPLSFAITTQSSVGDRVRLVGSFGSVTTPAQSGLSSAELSECFGAADGRELVAKLTLTATVESGLSADVGLDRLVNGPIGQAGVELIFPSPDGTSCNSNQDFGPPEFEFGSIPAHGSRSATLWAVLDDVITPDDPHPTASSLDGNYDIALPETYITGVPANITGVGGPSVIDCEAEDIPEYIIVGGAPPSSLTIQGQTDDCHEDPAP